MYVIVDLLHYKFKNVINECNKDVSISYLIKKKFYGLKNKGKKIEFIIHHFQHFFFLVNININVYIKKKKKKIR